MPQLADYARPHLHISTADPESTMRWMARETQLAQEDASLRLFAEKLVTGLFPHDYLSEYAAVLNWVRMHIRYSRDPVTIEQVKTPRAALETETGDCMTLDTKIIVRDRGGFYRLKTLGELRFDYPLYDALSYNFDKQEFEFKPITAWVDKGEQPVFEVRLVNGYSAFCTRGHKFFVWENRRNSRSYSVQALGDLWLGDKMAEGSSLLLAKQIPWLNNDSFWHCAQDPLFGAENMAWLAGAYLAEGWHSNHNVSISKQDSVDRLNITRRLEALGVPYAISKRKKSAYVSVHTHPFKEFLKRFGHRALVKHAPFEALSSSRPLVEQMLAGYVWGDTWVPDPNKPRKSHPKHVMMHSTVSNELAEQLKFIYLLLGRPLAGTLERKHGGLGKNPIWRLWEASGKQHPLYRPDSRPRDLTSKGVRFVECVGDHPTCDITIADNHNFVLSNGLLAHNCDDMSVLLGSLLGTLGAKIRYVAGAFTINSDGTPALTHVWCEAWEPNIKGWVVLDPVPGRRVGQMLSKLISAKMIMALE